MRQQGRSATLRPRSLPDRMVTALGARLPAGSRRMLGWLYGVLLRAVRSPQLTATLPTGERFRLLPRYRRMTWNIEEVEAFSADLQAGDIALDIGANVGTFTIPAARRCKHVYAVEMVPDIFRTLGNVTMDVAVTAVVDRSSGGTDPAA